MTVCHFLSRKYSDKSRTEARTEGAETSDEYLQSRRKCFHFMSYLTSHINKVRMGEEAKRVAEEDRLTFDRWWLVNPWGTTLPACTPWVTALASPPPLSPFYFSVSFAALSAKAPVSVRYVSFLLFFFFFSLDSLATTSFRRFQLWWSRVKMLRNTCNIPCGRSASL